MIEATVTKRNGDILKRARYSDLKRAGAQAVRSGTPIREEIAFLHGLRLTDKRFTALFCCRALQGLRDQLHFRTPQEPAGR